jgi:Tfp pilus assembly protein PilN
LGPIKVNLATFEYYDKRVVYSLILGAAILVLMLSAYTIQLSFRYQSDIFEYENKLVRLEQGLVKRQHIRNGIKVTLGKDLIKTIKGDTAFVNRLIIMDIFPWDHVLDGLEKEMPEGMILKSLAPGSTQAALTMKGESSSMAEISLFLSRLERSGMFEKTILSKLSVEQNASQKENENERPKILFEIEAALRINDLVGLDGKAKISGQKDLG